MDTSEKLFIDHHFGIKECYEFSKSEIANLCVCGKSMESHKTADLEESGPNENNNKNKVCYGSIKFEEYNEKYDEKYPKFLKFNDKIDTSIESKVFELLQTVWKFPQPKLLISVCGGQKRMNFKTQLQKKHFQQGLIDVMNKENTWLIGGGFKVGIHQLLSETVNEYRIFHEGHQNEIKLIGICTWGVVQNKEQLLLEDHVYRNTKIQIEKSVLLDALYDCYLFCDDGTEKEYDKEIDFRLKFEKCIQNQGNVFSVQILFEGGLRALKKVYMSLKQGVPLVVIKNSGRAANIICKLMSLTGENYKEKIDLILNEFKSTINYKTERQQIKEYLTDMFENYKNNIIMHDLLQENIKLDRKIVEAVYSSLEYNVQDATGLKKKTVHNYTGKSNQEENEKKKEILKLMVTFNCYDLADTAVFQSRMLESFQSDELMEMFLDVIQKNRPEFVGLFLDNYLDDPIYFDNEIFLELYKISTESRCRSLLPEDIQNENKRSHLDKPYKLRNSINEIIHQFSGNILKAVKFSEDLDCSNNDDSRELLVNYHNTTQDMIMRYRRVDSNKGKRVNIQDLFLWALLSGYIEMAVIFLKRLSYPVGSALIASIILNKMRILLLEKGESDMSEILSDASIHFQKMSASIILESYDNDEFKTFQILYRKMDIWNNLSCLQIAVSGKLLDFLNQSACRSYANQSWVGKFPTFHPTWKTRHVGCSRRIRLSQRKNINENNNNNKISSLTCLEAMKMFFQAPKVKFIVYLVSYIIFLLIFAYLNLLEMRPIDKNTTINNLPAEIFVYIYVFGLLIEEIRQIKNQERTGTIHKLSAHFSGSWNIYDVFIISLFIISSIFRFTLNKSNFIIARCLFSVTFSLFCLRTMQFYFISRFIGPKIIMIRKMIFDILFFLSIFILFLISYGTLIQTLQQENNELSLSLIKDVFYRPYFQTYGELMLGDFNVPSPCNTTVCVVQYTTMICGFAIFLLLTNILLINLLIAMFGHTFQKIQVESEKIFVFIQIQLVEEFYKKSRIMPPFNIISYMKSGVIHLYNYHIKKFTDPDSFLVKNLTSDECKKIDQYEKICFKYALLKAQEKAIAEDLEKT